MVRRHKRNIQLRDTTESGVVMIDVQEKKKEKGSGLEMIQETECVGGGLRCTGEVQK